MTTALGFARNQPSPGREMNLAIALRIFADRAAAAAALAKAIADRIWARTSPYKVARAYALRGDADNTVAWLERTPARHLFFLLADPLILRFRHDPRLTAFCEKNRPAPA